MCKCAVYMRKCTYIHPPFHNDVALSPEHVWRRCCRLLAWEPSEIWSFVCLALPSGASAPRRLCVCVCVMFALLYSYDVCVCIMFVLCCMQYVPCSETYMTYMYMNTYIAYMYMNTYITYMYMNTYMTYVYE